MIALTGGEDPPSYPEAEPNDCFQGSLTASGKLCAHVLCKYAQIMFTLGANHLSGRMTVDEVLGVAQGVGGEIAEELNNR